MRFALVVLAVLLFSPVAFADDLKPEDLKAMLKAEQDRKSQLAARVAELEKQVQAQNDQIQQLKRQAADATERTYFLNTYYAAWSEFIRINPAVQHQWEQYLTLLPTLAPNPNDPWYDPNWPLSYKDQ